ncbi:MAG: phenylalanine--tRNA ligase subunit alpha [Bacteroidales bacterium]|jgi:phenylalanyl-tRNA synthetase alpha chain|nr:phenylalanine--tRNA ligase subunit alpha [Bacteroidales bacterium]MBO7180752.1 phenylalanine--tRNA ligase subunit alpha [Bacteroidales bacterium]MEE0961416.1 phenylalanine--tRNA ligase subunit alpha [Bacteroidales bacterium]MEE0976345.1 phenylalanine--tRNA ligase subunit alpha [Bacteroidales bacterium]MEE1094458.1 phenylalanine--tRNA ligase subunit alpha [Bacteroidales bacterium]
MKQRIRQSIENLKQLSANTLEEIEQLRIQYLGKKGVLNDLFAQFKQIPNEEKREMGSLLNELKTAVQSKIDALREALEAKADNQINIDDLTKPAYLETLGSRHPISLVRNEICEIFAQIGYVVEEGPEIEDDWHVFSALNFPPEHPARDMQDTFFIENRADGNNAVLRTHTSSIQVRTMERQQPPIRIIAPGRVFRNEAISARAHCIFHQIEGLYIDKGVSFADLKQSLLYFAKEMFGNDTKIRLRPSYFPFTEPSAEMDVSCNLCGGKGCNVCKGTGWLEIMGCGMVDPNVLKSSGIDPDVYSGFAFGMGVERIAMLKYGVNDLRMYFENDVRFLNQFKSFI